MWRSLSAAPATLAPLLFWAGSALALEVNTATQAELEQMKGIGTALSQRLVDARAEHPFDDWADLIRRVPGLRAASASKLSAAGLTVQGKPYETVTPKSVSTR